MLRAVGPGYNLTATVRPDAATVTLSEAVFLTFAVRNDGTERITFSTDGAYRGSPRDNNYRITCTDENGDAARYGQAVRDGDATALQEASAALSEIDDEAVVPHLAAALERGDHANKHYATAGLGRFTSAAARAALVFALQDREDIVRRDAVTALATHNQLEAAVHDLREHAASVTTAVARTNIARGLGATGSRNAVAPLLAMLADGDAGTRRQVIQSLGQLGFGDAVDSLRTLLDDPEPMTRIRTIDALAELGQPLEVERLTQTLRALRTISVNGRELSDAVTLVRMRGGIDAVAALIGAIDLDDASGYDGAQGTLVRAVQATCGAPTLQGSWDFRAASQSEVEENAAMLAGLRAWDPAVAKRERATELAEATRLAVERYGAEEFNAMTQEQQAMIVGNTARSRRAASSEPGVDSLCL